jgi:hypothetical protein
VVATHRQFGRPPVKAAAVDLLRGLVLRSVPGALNLVALVIVGQRLQGAEFGLYSTAVASLTLVASLAYGPVIHSLVSQYARAEQRGLTADYLATTASVLTGITLAVLALGWVVVAAGFLHWLQLLVIPCFGLFRVMQELLRARLCINEFFVCALCQAATFVILNLAAVEAGDDCLGVLSNFLLSNVAGLLLSVLIARPRFSGVRNAGLMRDSMRIGFPYTLSTLAESGIFLGLRYLTMLFGPPGYIGEFSFCVDLAQRTVGFFVNIAGFMAIPRAFRRETSEGLPGFRRELRTSGLLSVTVALAVLAAVLLAYWLGLMDYLGLSIFDPAAFAIVSLAVIVNRSRKLLFDPEALRQASVSPVLTGYVAGSLVACTLGCAGLAGAVPRGVELAYLSGYTCAALLCAMLLRRRMPTGMRITPVDS